MPVRVLAHVCVQMQRLSRISVVFSCLQVSCSLMTVEMCLYSTTPTLRLRVQTALDMERQQLSDFDVQAASWSVQIAFEMFSKLF